MTRVLHHTTERARRRTHVTRVTRFSSAKGYIIQRFEVTERVVISPAGLSYMTAAVYTASLAFYLRQLFAGGAWPGRAATALLAGGLVTHYMALLERAISLHSVPYQDFYGSMSLLAWFLALTYLGLELLHRERAMGAFVLPLVLLLFGLELVVVPQVAPKAPAHGSIFALHVTANILAYSAFTLSFVYSVIY